MQIRALFEGGYYSSIASKRCGYNSRVASKRVDTIKGFPVLLKVSYDLSSTSDAIRVDDNIRILNVGLTPFLLTLLTSSFLMRSLKEIKPECESLNFHSCVSARVSVG